jgi:small ligand-binding sensory domain FIST
VLEILRVHGQIPLLAGCSSAGLIVGAQELEEEPGLVVGLYALPGAELRAIHFGQRQVQEATGVEYWPQQTGQSKAGKRHFVKALGESVKNQPSKFTDCDPVLWSSIQSAYSPS